MNVQLPAATASSGSPTISYSVTGLPAGLSFSSSTRRITGTPSTSSTGSLTYSATATGYTGSSRTASWSVSTAKTLSLASTSDQSWTKGTAVSLVLPAATASTGSPSISYSVSGLPAGLSFNSSTRTISGTPTTNSTGTITYSATATGYTSASDSIGWTVSSSGPSDFVFTDSSIHKFGNNVNVDNSVSLPADWFTDGTAREIFISLVKASGAARYYRLTVENTTADVLKSSIKANMEITTVSGNQTATASGSWSSVIGGLDRVYSPGTTSGVGAFVDGVSTGDSATVTLDPDG